MRDSAVLSDGTVVSGNADAVDLARSIDQDLQEQEQAWADALREQGIKAAHPDDGWVDRDENKVHLAYPQFNAGLEVGDLLALGSSYSLRPTRIVRVTGTSELRLFKPGPTPWYFHFEEIQETGRNPRDGDTVRVLVPKVGER